MSCGTTRIVPMRAPAASSSAKVGSGLSGRGACAPADPARTARQTRRQYLIGGCAVHRVGSGEERMQDVVRREVVLLLEARVRDAGHHGELLVGMRQPLEE